MTLSVKAIKDLRLALKNSYGVDFESSLNDEEISEIGDLILTVLAEELNLKVQQRSSDLFLEQRV